MWRDNEQFLSDLGATPALELSEDQFVKQTLARRTEPTKAPSLPRRRARALAAVSIALAAAAALLVATPRSTPQQGPVETFASRGTGPEFKKKQAHASAELFFVRGGVFRPLSAEALHPGDGLAVRCTNSYAYDMRLSVFAIDADGAVHWIYPAFLHPDPRAESIVLESGTQDRMLSEVVEPDAPAQGGFRVFAVLSRMPITVQQVEEHRRDFFGAAAPSFLAGAQVQHWSTTWNAD